MRILKSTWRKGRLRPTFVLLTSLFAFSAPIARAEIIEPYSAGVWSGGAETNSSGTLVHCFLSARARDPGFLIVLRWDEEGLHLTLYDEKWTFEKGKEFQARVKIDGRYDQNVSSSYLATDVVDYLFKFDKAALKALQRGNRISLQSPTQEYAFALQGTSRALTTLLRCAKSQNYPLEQPAEETTPVPVLPSAAYQAGLKAYRAEDYKTAFKMWSASAQQGHAEAQNGLGALYYFGGGVRADLALAAKWFRASADQGEATAQNNLGEMYRDGEGVKRDYALASQWFGKAADQGHAKAQKNLDAMIADGLVEPQGKSQPLFVSGVFQGDISGSENFHAKLHYMIDGETVTGRVDGTWLPTPDGTPVKVQGNLTGVFDPDSGIINFDLRAFGAVVSIRGKVSGLQTAKGFSGTWQPQTGPDGDWSVQSQTLSVTGMSTHMCGVDAVLWKSKGGYCG